MQTIILVAKNEIITKLTQKSFWMFTFILPLALFGMSFGLQLLSIGMVKQTLQEDTLAMLTQEEDTVSDQRIGYVDQAGVLSTLPSDLSSESLQAFPDEATAQEALNADEIMYYYIIPPNFIETGDLVVIENEFRPLRHLNTNSIFRYVLTYNLSGDSDSAKLLQDPLKHVNRISLSPDATAHGANNPLTHIVPILTMFAFFYVLTTSSGFMLESVSKEKSNHLLEVILLSIHPHHLIAGKIVGLSVVALVQMIIWSAGSILITGSGALIRLGAMLSSEDTLSLVATQQIQALSGGTSTPTAMTLPQGFLLWGILYMILGYLLYATALGTIGALISDSGESGIMTLIAYAPLLLSTILSLGIIRAPHGSLAIILSLFPLTSPISMMTRLAATKVPILQILLSLILLSAATYGMVALTAHILRPETLLSTRALTLKRFWKGKTNKAP